MKDRIFTPKPAPTISINGHEFELKLSEIDVAQRVMDAKTFCTETLSKEGVGAADVITAGRQIERAINDICGENAMKTMIDGKVIRVREAIELLAIVEEEATGAYAQEILDRYA